MISRKTYNFSNDSIGSTIRVESDRHGNHFDGYATERISNVDPETGVEKFALAAGSYSAFLRRDRPLPRVELLGTPGYRNVQIHVGNTPARLRGCFAAGESAGARPGEVGGSATAMRLIEEVIRQDATGKIRVVVEGPNNMTPFSR